MIRGTYIIPRLSRGAVHQVALYVFFSHGQVMDGIQISSQVRILSQISVPTHAAAGVRRLLILWLVVVLPDCIDQMRIFSTIFVRYT